MSFYVYMLRLRNGQIYVGSSANPYKRFNTHAEGYGSVATRKSKPAELIYSEPFPDRASAVRRELQLKGWSRAKKVALAEGKINELRHWSKHQRSKPSHPDQSSVEDHA